MAEFDAVTLAEQAVMIGLMTRSQFFEVMEDAEDGSIEALTRSMLRKGILTSWQRDKLVKGEVRGFFYGNCKVLFHIAEGTFARVYRGVRVHGNQPVAIKVLRRRFTSDQAAVSRFNQEAEAGMRLVHPNIVRIYEYGEQDGLHYMVMEYVEGSNLRDFLKIRHRLDAEEALPIMIGMARGLQYSLNHGVTHRDIKGTNILISTKREAKLVDFGLATVADDRVTEFAHTRTVDYSALERTCHSPKGDPRSDIYFLGCVYYQLLTGVLPLPEVETSDPLAKMLKRSFGAIKPLHEHRHAPPEELCRIIEKMMKIDLRLRYQTMDDVVADLEAFAKSMNAPVPEIVTTSEAAEPSDGDILRDAMIAKKPRQPEAQAAHVPAPAPQPQPAPAPRPQPQPEFDPLDLLDPDSIPDPDFELMPHAENPAVAEVEAEAAPGKQVLCVEVQSEIQQAFRKVFSKMGYEVLMVGDAFEAALRYLDTQPELVVFDIDGLGPNGLNGFLEIYKRARAAGRELSALVLLGPRQGELAGRLPGDDRVIVLSKPIKMKDVQEGIAQLLSVRH